MNRSDRTIRTHSLHCPIRGCALSHPRVPVVALAVAVALALLGITAPGDSAAQGLRMTPGIGAAPAPARPQGLGAPAAAPSAAPSFLQPGAPSAPRAPLGPQPADYIVAVVNSEPITNNEVRARLVRVEQQLAQQQQALPPRGTLVREVVERLITEKSQLQLARENGIKIDDLTVDSAELNVARQNGMDVATLRRGLTSEGVTAASFREDLRNQLLLTRLREQEIARRVRVSEFEVDQFLREQKASQDPSQVELNLAHILVGLPEGATPAQVAQAEAKAKRAAERARAGEEFAKLAAELSDVPDARQNGGVIGLRTADRYPPLFVQATANLKEGGVSEVVRSQAGFHVIKLVDRRSSPLAGGTVTQTRARHILLKPGGALTETAARERLADYRRRVLANQADFAQLAKEHSADGSSKQGGDLGWTNPGQFVPEFEETMSDLKPGEIAEPMVSRFGVHLIQVLERREAQLSERERREVARNLAREKKLDEEYARWSQDVRGRAFVELREPPS